MFSRRARKYVGAYYATVDACDALIFTGGIGENAAVIRSEICRGLDRLGFVLDPERNEAPSSDSRIISTDDSPQRIMVIPTNEELLIARDTFRTLVQPVVGV